MRPLKLSLLRAAVVGLGAWPALAFADPCRAPLPSRPGVVIAGPVRYVGDGDSLCVGPARDAGSWIEIRLSDFDAPELPAPGGAQAKARLSRLVMGRRLVCTTRRGRQGGVIVHDRVIARCTVDGRPLGRLIREAGGRDGGR